MSSKKKKRNARNAKKINIMTRKHTKNEANSEEASGPLCAKKMMLRCRAWGETGRPGRWEGVLIISYMAVASTGQTLARISTMPGRSTFGFHQTGRGCLHKARSVGGRERTRRDRAGQGRTGQDRTGQDRAGQDRTGQDRIEQNTASPRRKP